MFSQNDENSVFNWLKGVPLVIDEIVSNLSWDSNIWNNISFADNHQECPLNIVQVLLLT